MIMIAFEIAGYPHKMKEILKIEVPSLWIEYDRLFIQFVFWLLCEWILHITIAFFFSIFFHNNYGKWFYQVYMVCRNFFDREIWSLSLTMSKKNFIILWSIAINSVLIYIFLA